MRCIVLAREGAAAMGDLRYYADVKADGPRHARWHRRNWAPRWPPTATSRAPTACSRSRADARRTTPAPIATLWRSDYGTPTRDAARACWRWRLEAGSDVH